jgi:hypothetical protein
VIGIGPQSAFTFRVLNAVKGEKKSELVLIFGFLLAIFLLFSSGLQRISLSLSEMANVRIGLFWSIFAVVSASIIVALAEFSGKSSWLVASLELPKPVRVQQQGIGFAVALIVGLIIVFVGYGLSSNVSVDDLVLTVLAAVYLTFLGGLTRFLTSINSIPPAIYVKQVTYGIPAFDAFLTSINFRNYSSKMKLPTTWFSLLRRPKISLPTKLVIGICIVFNVLACIATNSLLSAPAGVSLAIMVFQLDRYQIGSLHGTLSTTFETSLWSMVFKNWKALAFPHSVCVMSIIAMLVVDAVIGGHSEIGIVVGSVISTLFAPVALWFWIVESTSSSFLAAALRVTLLSVVVFVLLVVLSPLGAFVLWIYIKRARAKLVALELEEPYRWIKPN